MVFCFHLSFNFYHCERIKGSKDQNAFPFSISPKGLKNTLKHKACKIHSSPNKHVLGLKLYHLLNMGTFPDNPVIESDRFPAIRVLFSCI